MSEGDKKQIRDLSSYSIKNITRNINITLQNIILKIRWLFSSNKIDKLKHVDVSGLSLCDVFYINLAYRVDRRSHIENQFKQLSLQSFTRIDAIKDRNGALGCTKSHLAVLKAYQPKPNRLLMICEDDCTFLVDRKKINELIDDFSADNRFKVLCLAYNAKNRTSVTNSFSITSNTMTASCYILKPEIINDMIDVAKESIVKFEAGKREKKAAIDVVWKRLQKKYFFVIPNDRVAYQIESYSDIMKKEVSYSL